MWAAETHGFLAQITLYGFVAIVIDSIILLAYGSLSGVFSSSANRYGSKRINYLISGLRLIGVAVWLALS